MTNLQTDRKEMFDFLLTQQKTTYYGMDELETTEMIQKIIDVFVFLRDD